MPDPESGGRVVAYVSGHGFGHAAREIEILRHLPPDIPLTVKSTSPEWFWRAEMGRPFDFVADSFDVGCVQRDSIEIDVHATYDAWIRVAERNKLRFFAEVESLKTSNARVVVADVASMPLAVAAEIGIPCLCVANFTWADIYEHFVPEEPRFAPVVEDLTRQYENTTLCLDTDLSLPMPYFQNISNVGLVARPGISRRERLEAKLPPDARNRKLALIYLGEWGYPIPYPKFEQFSDWHFLSLNEPPEAVKNWTVIGLDSGWKHPDLVASVDLVVSKPGYGIVAECLSLGTPILYPPRPQFCEYTALETALTAWPGGLQIPREDFLALNWRTFLDAVPARATIPLLPAEGGPNAARRIAGYFHANGRTTLTPCPPLS